MSIRVHPLQQPCEEFLGKKTCKTNTIKVKNGIHQIPHLENHQLEILLQSGSKLLPSSRMGLIPHRPFLNRCHNVFSPVISCTFFLIAQNLLSLRDKQQKVQRGNPFSNRNCSKVTWGKMLIEEKLRGKKLYKDHFTQRGLLTDWHTNSTSKCYHALT